MTFVLNRPADPPPPPSLILDRDGLVRAGRTISAARILSLLLLLIIAAAAILATPASQGASLGALPLALVLWLIVEILVVAARACVAAAWALRGQPPDPHAVP